VGQVPIPDAVAKPPEPTGSIFPEGWFRGSIQSFDNNDDRIRSVPWDETEVRLNLKLGDNEAIEGSDPGQRKFFPDFTLIKGNNKIDTVEAAKYAESLRNKNGEVPKDWMGVAIGFMHLVSLGQALGFVQGGTFDPMEFAELLGKGTFDGQQVVFRVYHNKGYANLAEFAPA
jgi:hypothetical protein